MNITNESVLEELRKQQLPLWLWGCGNVAHEVHAMLRSNAIAFAGCFVDMESDVRTFEGKPVVTLDHLSRNIHRGGINVLLAHAQYHRGKELAAYPAVKHVYYLPNPFQTHEDISETYVEEHREVFERAYRLLDETLSQRVFHAYLEARTKGNLDAVCEAFTQPMTYFVNDIWVLTHQESYVDCGAYDGDTIRSFMQAVDANFLRIDAFEPDAGVFRTLSKNVVALSSNENIHLYRKGLWNENTVRSFASDEEQSGFATETFGRSECGKSVQTIKVCRLDDVIHHPVSLIKVNMSGPNKECLEGAARLIARDKPKIAVTVGLTRERLWQIPLLLHEIQPEYRFFLRFLESMPSRICLFCR